MNKKFVITLLVLFGIALATTLFLFRKVKIDATPLLDVSPITVPSSTPEPTKEPDVRTFQDKALPGFSFMYDANKWNAVSADVKDCNETKCGAAYGKIISITNNLLEEGPEKFQITISVVDAKTFSGVDTSPICFSEDDLRIISDEWVSARSPFEGPAHQEMQKMWPRYIYRSTTVKQVDGKSCIKGALNLAEQEKLPVKYKGSPTIIQIYVNNRISSTFDSTADEIVKTIQFK